MSRRRHAKRVWYVGALVAMLITGVSPPGNSSVGVAQAEQALLVAAAADLRFALEDITRKFEKESNAHIRLVFGSSGQLATQIEQGAPYDVFFSADDGFVAALADKGLVDRQTVQLYAFGRIVLWVRHDSLIDVGKGFAVLLDPQVRYVAIANPQHAPYGRAAVQALRSAGVLTRVQPKLVLGENITGTFQLVQTGNADVGIVALALAVAPTNRNTGRYWLIPGSLYPPIRQAVAVVSGSGQHDLAAAFIAYVNGPSGRAILRRAGFTLPGESI